jgi:DNA-binding FadR family transcriptional regulator
MHIVNEQHKAIYEAIAEGSAERAHEAMLAHLTSSLERLRNAIAEEPRAT